LLESIERIRPGAHKQRSIDCADGDASDSGRLKSRPFLVQRLDHAIFIGPQSTAALKYDRRLILVHSRLRVTVTTRSDVWEEPRVIRGQSAVQLAWRGETGRWEAKKARCATSRIMRHRALADMGDVVHQSPGRLATRTF